jgi:hypothetical protein
MGDLFTSAMALREVASGADGPAYDGELSEHWTIGPKLHGGVMVALCANAACTAYGGAGLERCTPQRPRRPPTACADSIAR